MNMFDKIVVHKALKRCLVPDSGNRIMHHKLVTGQDTLISLLIHDIFGGEILKTHTDKVWHFYNRINGERIDFTGQKPINLLRRRASKIFLPHPMRLMIMLIRRIIRLFYEVCKDIRRNYWPGEIPDCLNSLTHSL